MTKQMFLTEWLSETNAKDLQLHIYKLPLTDLENRHSSLSKVRYILSGNNNFLTIVYNDLYIGSFAEIENWTDVKEMYSSYEKRTVDLKNKTERVLLEKLIKADLLAINRDQYIIDNFGLKSQKIYRNISNNILIYYGLHLDVKVNISGEIRVGFDRRFKFEFKETLEDILLKNMNNLKEGDKVIDYNNRRTYEYEFLEVANYTFSEHSSYLNSSIKEYYNRINQLWKVKNIPDDALVVHVRNNEGGILPYIAKHLKRKCDYGSIPDYLRQSVNRAIKLNAESRIKPLLSEVYRILTKHPKLKFPKENSLINISKYEHEYLENPLLRFGNNITNKYILSGLRQGGVYTKGAINISFFVDPILHSQENLVLDFINKIVEISKKLNVEMNISKKPGQIRDQLSKDLFSSNNLTLKLKELSANFEGTVVVLTTGDNINNSYNQIKREFGGKLDITTQFVEFDEKLTDPKTRGIDFYLHNILLGIYAKSGIQPWILGENLSSDCFIGLDVSHMEGRHSSGIIQVIGRDGRLIRQTTTSTHESGEKISAQSLQDVVSDSLHAYKQMYGSYPKHITFHRDGICREDLVELEKRLSELKVEFDYIEIIKNSNRRMVTFQNKKWFTEQGLYYKRNKTAYLCATDPRETVGMAKPIKIVQKTNALPFDKIIKDVYWLSFMHIHSLLKTRLPITTHYADISSHFHNKGLLHPRTEHVESLPFV